MSPFSCFSPTSSYEQTLPRHYDPGAGGGRSAPSSPSKSLSATEFGPPSPSPARKLKRASYGPGGFLEKRVVQKREIGLPYNFVHEGHVGRPVAPTKRFTLDLTQSISAALTTPNLALTDTPSFPTRDLPTPTTPTKTPLGESKGVNGADPALAAIPTTTAAPTTSAPAGVKRAASVGGKRKPPPPVTASVIKQAGLDIVQKTGGVTPTATPVPPPLTKVITPSKSTTESSIIIPVSVPRFQAGGLKISNPDSSLTTSTSSSDTPPPVPSATTKPGGAGVGEMGQVNGNGRGYMTGTAKKRWDGAMKEVEEALLGEGV